MRTKRSPDAGRQLRPSTRCRDTSLARRPRARCRRATPRTVLVVLALLALLVGGCNRRITDGDQPSHHPAISGDGRYVTYYSTASNLVAGDTNGRSDIFVWDRSTSSTTRITDGNGDSDMPDISDDGRYIAYNGAGDVFVYDQESGTTERISDTEVLSELPVISGDGRFVAYTSHKFDLMPEEGYRDVFLHDRTIGTTTRITAGTGQLGGDALDLSGDGRYLLFGSDATNLTPGETTPKWRSYVFDRVTSTIVRIPADTASSLSDDGRYVVYMSDVAGSYPSVRNVFVLDRTTGATTRVTDGDRQSYGSDISGDGTTVALISRASNLVPGDDNGQEDVFVHDLTTGTTSRVTDSDGGWMERLGISTDGRYLAFDSNATNLAQGDEDTNGVKDVFTTNRGKPTSGS